MTSQAVTLPRIKAGWRPPPLNTWRTYFRVMLCVHPQQGCLPDDHVQRVDCSEPTAVVYHVVRTHSVTCKTARAVRRARARVAPTRARAVDGTDRHLDLPRHHAVVPVVASVMPMDYEPTEFGHELGDRVIAAVAREFEGEPQHPRLVIVVELPPDGRINIISQGDDDVDTHRMLALGAASVRNCMTPADKKRARRLWNGLRAGFERRN